MEAMLKKIVAVAIGGIFLGLSVSWIGMVSPVLARGASEKTYVGSQACMECHEVEYENFTLYAKKATSYDSVIKMKKGLSGAEIKECYACHTTGYGQPGGFVSMEETPHLRDAGCEVCHGPGSLHLQTEDPDDILANLSMDNCLTCHNSERVGAFNFKPLLHGGAH
ncbi:MAG: cytochrome C [Desulfobacterales bacterium]|nr:cytochrome C [Desulfobacterales bacterium]